MKPCQKISVIASNIHVTQAYVNAQGLESEASRAAKIRSNNAFLESLLIKPISATQQCRTPRNNTKVHREKSRGSARITTQNKIGEVQRASAAPVGKIFTFSINRIPFASKCHLDNEVDSLVVCVSEAQHLHDTVNLFLQSSRDVSAMHVSAMKIFTNEIIDTLEGFEDGDLSTTQKQSKSTLLNKKKQRYGPWCQTNLCYRKLMHLCLPELEKLGWLDYIYLKWLDQPKLQFMGVIAGIYLLMKVTLYTFLSLQAMEKPR